MDTQMVEQKKPQAQPVSLPHQVLALYVKASAEQRAEVRKLMREVADREQKELQREWEEQFKNKEFIITRGKLKGQKVLVLAQAAGGKRPLVTAQVVGSQVFLPHVAMEDLRASKRASDAEVAKEEENADSDEG
jgi:hypothetical protein